MDIQKISLLIFVFAGCVTADHKRWKPNTNFENSANWEQNVLPCENDILTFPENLGAVYVQTNTTISEMVLPMNGEFILGDYVSISFPVSPSYKPGCPLKREIKFTRTDPKSWLDPKDWCVTAQEGADCQAEQQPLLVSEQVPCQGDTTLFPQKSSFLVGLGDGVDIKIGSLIIDGTSYTTSTFKNFVDGEKGKEQFVRGTGTPATTITVTGDQCKDDSGCACGNDQGVILDKICATSAGDCGDGPKCTDPLRPMGACCDMCGAVMKLDIKQSFKKQELENIIKRYIYDEAIYKGIKSIVSKTSLGQIQVVISDGDNGDTATEFAILLQTKLNANAGQYGITNVKLELSQDIQPTPSGRKGIQLGGGSIAGIVLSILVVAAIIAVVLFFLVTKRRRPSIPLPINVNITLEKMRAAFQNLGGSHGAPELELGSVSFKNNMPIDDVSGFDNPLYGESGPKVDLSDVKISYTGQPVLSATPGPIPVTLEAVSDASGGFSNPIYGKTPIDVDFRPLEESNTTQIGTSATNKPVDRLTYPDATDAGFSNPLYATPAKESVKKSSAKSTNIGPDSSAVLVLNPVFSTLNVDSEL